MIDAFQNVHETGFDETQRGLMPAWIQRYQAGIAVQFECPLCAIARQETQADRDTQPQPVEPRPDGERGLRRLNRVLEQHVELCLIPEHIETIRQPGSMHARERLLEARERLVGWHRYARFDETGIRQARIAL